MLYLNQSISTNRPKDGTFRLLNPKNPKNNTIQGRPGGLVDDPCCLASSVSSAVQSSSAPQHSASHQSPPSKASPSQSSPSYKPTVGGDRRSRRSSAIAGSTSSLGGGGSKGLGFGATARRHSSATESLADFSKLRSTQAFAAGGTGGLGGGSGEGPISEDTDSDSDSARISETRLA